MIENTEDVLDAVLGDACERQRLAAAWRSLPDDDPLPDTPEVREMVARLFVGMYGEAWKELEKR